MIVLFLYKRDRMSVCRVRTKREIAAGVKMQLLIDINPLYVNNTYFCLNLKISLLN